MLRSRPRLHRASVCRWPPGVQTFASLSLAGPRGAIAAAFGAPLAGAFYGFEVVLGTYTVGALAPVATSALVASQIARNFEGSGFLIQPESLTAIGAGDLVHIVAIGGLCGLAGILLMLTVAACGHVLQAAAGCEPLAHPRSADCS